MTQPLDTTKPWESGLIMVLGAEPMDRRAFLGMPWISITGHRVESKPPEGSPGENKFNVFRKLDGGTRITYVSGYMGNPVPIETNNPDNYLILDGEVNWYMGGEGKSPHDHYVNEFLASTNKALDSGPNGNVLNAPSLDSAAETYYNTWTWLGQAVQRLQTEIGKVDGAGTGFEGTAAAAFIQTLENLRDELKMLQADLKTNQDWVQMLHDNATAARTWWSKVKAAWDDFYYHKPDPSKMLSDVLSQIQTQAQALNGQPAATGEVTSWQFKLNFGNGEHTYDFLQDGVKTLNTDLQNFWSSNAANLDSTITTQVTALRDSFDKTRMNMHDTRTYLPPPSKVQPPPGTNGDTNGDGKFDIDDLIGDGGNNGGGNNGGPGGGGNIDIDDLFGDGDGTGSGGGNNGGPGGGGNVDVDDLFGGNNGGGNNGGPGGGGSFDTTGNPGPDGVFSASTGGDGLDGLNGGAGTGPGGGFAGGPGGIGAFGSLPGGRGPATVTARNGSGGNGPTVDGLTDFTGGDLPDGPGTPGATVPPFGGQDGPATVDPQDLTGGVGGGANLPPLDSTGPGQPGFAGAGGQVGNLPGGGQVGNVPGGAGASGLPPGADHDGGTQLPGALVPDDLPGGGTGPGGGAGIGDLGGSVGSGGGPGGGSGIGDLGGGGLPGLGGDGASLPWGPNNPPPDNGFTIGPLGTFPDSGGMDFGNGAYGGNGTWASGGPGAGGAWSGGGSGSGLGGAGAALGGLAAGGGPAGAAGAAGATATGSSGAPPMMPPMMPPLGGMGGLGGNQEKERERTTWLAEDEEVWGTDPDVTPAVIGRDEFADTDDAERAPWQPTPQHPNAPYGPARGGGRATNRGY